MRVAIAALAVTALAGPLAAQDMVPFVIPTTPNEKSAIAAAAPPIATDGPRLTVADGHFALAGKRVRIWGVNTCFAANFPTHADAERIAARMAQAGVNSVRFHHMDTQAWPRGILDPKDPRKLHPEALDRLDYFIDQLAKRGIWSNINLHVGRTISRSMGLPEGGASYDKVTGIFMPALIEAQKQYARDVLTHVNAYRKVRYADDPAVAFVEITNEDSLFMWGSRQKLERLPEVYAQALRTRYAAWLKARYGGTDGLRRAWSEGELPLGENMLVTDKVVEGGDAKARGWRLEQHAPCSAKAVRKDDGTLRIEIAKADGTNWHIQMKQTPLIVKAGQYYTISFRARADQPRNISYSVQQDHEPWNNLGIYGWADLTTDWKTVRTGFVAAADDEGARLSFSVGGSTAAVELADVLLAPGGRTGLGKDESIEAASVALFGPGEVPARARDRLLFLADTEKAYFDDMYAFIKKDIGARALVTGTIVYGPLGLYGQSGMDYIDSHSYWQHPHFPGRPWDPGNWIVEQRAMVDQPGSATLPRIACERLDGKPFTLSEYNHPAPNDYQAECVPLVAAYAAAQDWDGIWLFAYSHAEEVERDHFTSFFDIDANPSKWGFMRLGTALFRDGGLPPLGKVFSVSLGGSDKKMMEELAALYQKVELNLQAAVAQIAELKWENLLAMRVAVALEGHSGVEAAQTQAEPVLAWKVDGQKRGTFSASGPGGAVLVTRAAGAAAVAAEGLEVSKPDFAALMMAALDGRPLEKSQAILIAACGRCENTGMQFSADRRTVGRNWGKGPVCIEPVEGRALLPAGQWRCQALAPDGTPAADVPVVKDDKGRPAVRLSPDYKTMWYLVTPAK